MNTALLRIAGIALGSLVLGCSSDDKDSGSTNVVSCEGAYTPCGGDVTGTWELGTLCVVGSVTNALNALLADYPSCANTFTEGRLESTGSVTYTATNFTRTGSVHLTGKMKITSACFGEQLMGAALTAQSCGSYAQVAPAAMAAQCSAGGSACTVTVSCGYEGTTCNCDADMAQQIADSGTYTVSGTTLTESTGGSYSFCVNGNQLSQSGEVYEGVAGVAYLNKK
jgi:hypothetical protein